MPNKTKVTIGQCKRRAHLAEIVHTMGGLTAMKVIQVMDILLTHQSRHQYTETLRPLNLRRLELLRVLKLNARNH